MTRFAIDALIALRIVRAGFAIGAGHALVAPNLLRSEALSMLYRDVREGRLEERIGRDQLEGLAELKIRLLGDRVSRATAWKIAAQLGWDDTPAAEYLAVATLQADALITDDPGLRPPLASWTCPSRPSKLSLSDPDPARSRTLQGARFRPGCVRFHALSAE